LVHRVWNSLPVRWQILIAIAVLGVLAGLFAGGAAVADARHRAKVEIAASLEVAGRLLKETHLAPGGDVEDLAVRLNRQLQHLRHVRITIAGASGREHMVLPRTADLPRNASRAPRWLSEAVGPAADPREILMTSETGETARATLTGEPADEIAEVWDDLTKLLVLWGGANAGMMIVLYIVLGRIFEPLTGLSEGMRSLQAGQYGARVAPPRVKELAGIAANFNTLAAALYAARAENRRLYRDLIAVQENERRQIANELHDEFGPCLFGLTANASSIEAVSGQLDGGVRDKLVDRAREIQSITARLKTMNRGLLKKLRPIVLGKVSLPELLLELLAEIERRHPTVELEREIGDLGRSYGEDVDLTIYRCVQEGVTNAIRHGKAGRVIIELRENMESDGATPAQPARRLVLSLSDDGLGMAPSTPPGFGLCTMRERVEALGGGCIVSAAEPRGAVVEVSIPVNGAPSAEPPAAGGQA
jgi:two-component system sensor histidine kinase UhpB